MTSEGDTELNTNREKKYTILIDALKMVSGTALKVV